MYITGTILLSLFGALGANGLVFAVGRSRQRARRHADLLPALDTADNGPDVALDTELRTAAAQAFGEAAQRVARIEFAVREGLTLRTNRSALRAALIEVIGCALHDPSCGRILLAATRQVGRVRIAVTDDCLTREKSVREAALRSASETIAMQGGSLYVEIRPGEGTTVALHFPIPLAAITHRINRRRGVTPEVEEIELVES